LNKRTVLQPEERRQQLLQAATWVFARRGYRLTGVSDIIARAGVARGTFYLYFESKHQIFLAVVSAFHDQVAEALDRIDAEGLGQSEEAGEAARAEGARAMIAASFKRWLEFFAAHRDATAVVLREASSIDPRFEQGFLELRQSALDHFAARLRRLQSLGLVNQDLSPEFVARLQLGMFDELINTFVLRDTGADLGAVAEQLAAFMWDGLKPGAPGA
jgi:AcrR family transcriptional regulator